MRCTCGFKRGERGCPCNEASIYKWKSVAVWPESFRIPGTRDNTTTDRHMTRGQAEGVCRLLMKHGFGGQGKVFPVETRVEKV